MSLRQSRARFEQIPIKDLYNDFSPMDEFEVTIEPES